MFNNQKQDGDSKPVATDKGSASLPSISLPKGGGAIRGIGEKFAANPVTGTGSMTVPIATSPGRSGFGPQLLLAYDSGAGNGPFGFGWNLSLPAITRKTDKGLPKYEDADESDVFILSGAEDLVPVLVEVGGQWQRDSQVRTVNGVDHRVQRYRPRIEGLFARIERWTNLESGEFHWRSISRDNITTFYGKTAESCIADPADSTRIFSWLICESYDDKGNAIFYKYKEENSDGVDFSQANEKNRTPSTRSANRYLKRIKYGNRTPRKSGEDLSLRTDWLFEVVFDYGEHYIENDQGQPTFVTIADDQRQRENRQDPFSSYRAGFEVRTYRLCRRVLMFHHFPNELEVDDCLVRSTEFVYKESPIASFITQVTQAGYVLQNGKYLKKSLPPLEFEYSEAVISPAVHEIDDDSLENLPYGVDGSHYQWVDLDGEGVSGILTEQANGWFYKRNLSPNHLVPENGTMRTAARFGPTEIVATKPAAALAGHAQFMDLAGDGQVDLVQFDGPVRGFYERTDDASWEPFRPFDSWPNVDTRDSNLKFVDLDGDGHSDILISENEVFTWHPSLAERGFGPARQVHNPFDEEKGPKLVFADGAQSIYLADLSGDGLTDLVRLRNGEVCYWPNLGYGRFGAKVTMDKSPWFDRPDQFNQQRIRLADIDGSGTTDIIYLGCDRINIYRNQAGNSWSDPESLMNFPRIDHLSAVMAVDLLGNGTACLLWSSPLPGDARRPMRYIDLMGGQKPHLLISTKNNLGAETRVLYAPSTKFYLDDKASEKPWITRLPFPVHVVALVETYDYISHNRFVTRYAYHHGYFDGSEREFRGFGMVEQFDTEEFAALSAGEAFPTGDNIDAASHVPPVHTKTWFHTGIYLGREHVSDFFAGLLDAQDQGEYYRTPGLTDAQARQFLLDDTVLPEGLTAEEECEACRSLKGAMLRQEVYALDGTEKEKHPYTVAEQNFTIRCLQPHAGNPYAVFFTHAREALSYHYERNPLDPRITHALTLEVDDFGNVLKSAAVGYGRRQPDMTLSAEDRDKQTQSFITYAENRVTNAIEAVDDYRTPLPCEARTYELTGYTPTGAAGRFQASDFVKPDPNDPDGQKQVHVFDSEINYEEKSTTGKQRRLIEHVRTLYRRNDLAGPLPFGELQSLALPFESYKLAFTPGLLAGVYGGLVTDAMLETEGRYVHSEGDANWWIPSGRIFFSPGSADTPAQELGHASQHFFLPHRYRDPFHINAISTESFVSFDAYDLLLVETRDALGNRVTVGERDAAGNLTAKGNDYRVLQPRVMMDPNRNRAAVAFDTLGMVVGTAVMGKPEENLGDSLEGFEADLTKAVILDHLQNPLADPNAILGRATTRLVYDLFAYQRTKDQPNPQSAVVYTLVRETHDSDPVPAGGLKSQHSFSYSDGFGREIQKKIQAEPGPVPKRDADGKIIVWPNGQPEMTDHDVSPRWVGSGWTVFNNKGKPIRQYEPFFTDTHRFEFEVKIGVSPVLFYDPVERVVATLHPNHTWEKVVFDPWRQESWDVNDTVLVADPKTDPDVGDFFQRLPDGEYLPTWYTQRESGALGPQEQAAASKAAIHEETPTVAHADSLGRTFLTVAHNKFKYSNTPPADPPTEEFYETRVIFDIEGNQREVIDAKDRVVMRYDYDMLGSRIHQASMEAGERWMLNDVAGKPLYAWDSRNHQFRTAYDQLRRPTASFLREGADAELLVGRTVYGEARPTPEAKNLRGKPVQLFDQAGVVTSDDYDFKGNLLSSRRQLAQEYKATLDWSTTVLLEADIYTSRTRYDALNRPTELTAPDNSVIRLTYNEANLLERVEANLRGAADATPSVANIDYDAKGQRTLIEYGNGARTAYTYDPDTFRLIHLRTTRSVQSLGSRLLGLIGLQRASSPEAVQDLSYTYDPVGNITHIRDDAQQTIYFRNKRVEPSTDYVYDAIYRLIEATGREHLGQLTNAPIPHSYNDALRVGLLHPGDGNAMGTYLERYVYDAVGNFLSMRHIGSDHANPGWTRTYAYAETSLIEDGTGGTLLKTSNRLTSTIVGNGNPITEQYGYDAHGNMLTMPQLQVMQWDYRDQLQMTQRQAVNDADEDGQQHQGERTYYVYDRSGQRVRKVTERQAAAGLTPTRMKERIYLGGFEVYREYENDGDTVKLERETLHIMDDKQRIALIETRTQGNEPGVPQQLIRYQFGNHLGSASMELDDQAQIITYEEYTPYGSTSYQAVRRQTETPKRYRYTGMERDEESGLEYHSARYYAPWLARWLSPDPLGLDAGINVYRYVNNNPILMIDRSGTDGIIPVKTDVLHDKELQKKLSSYEDLVWSSMTNLHSKRQAAQVQTKPQPVPPAKPASPGAAPIAKPTTNKVVHVRVDDLSHPLSSEAILKKVEENFAKIGINVDVQFGQFVEEDFRNRRDNIQITILSPQFNVADQILIRDAFVDQGWKKPGKIVADTVRELQKPENEGISSGFSTDPLANLIFVKEIDPTTRRLLEQSFTLMYPGNRDEAAKALDVYFYADPLTHEIGHNFGLGHSTDTRNFMFSPAPGQQKHFSLESIVSEREVQRLKSDPSRWGQRVRSELNNWEKSFSKDQIDLMRGTLEKFWGK